MDFIKVASACPKTKVADVEYNVGEILKCIKEANDKDAKAIVFPELCITSYTCADLFLQDRLINEALKGIVSIMLETSNMEIGRASCRERV